MKHYLSIECVMQCVRDSACACTSTVASYPVPSLFNPNCASKSKAWTGLIFELLF